VSVTSAVSGLQIPASLQNADGTPKVSNSASTASIFAAYRTHQRTPVVELSFAAL
jgi:hypothetical protein